MAVTLTLSSTKKESSTSESVSSPRPLPPSLEASCVATDGSDLALQVAAREALHVGRQPVTVRGAAGGGAPGVA